MPGWSVRGKAAANASSTHPPLPAHPAPSAEIVRLGLGLKALSSKLSTCPDNELLTPVVYKAPVCNKG